MKKYISRKEAAEILGCIVQTITNYAERNLIKTIVNERGMFIEKESFERFIKDFFTETKVCDDISKKLNDQLAELKEQVEKKEAELKNRLTLLDAGCKYAAFVSSAYPAMVMGEYLKEVGDVLLDEKSVAGATEAFNVIRELCSGVTYNTLAERCGEDLVQMHRLAYRGMMTIKHTHGFVKALKDENEALRKRCARQHRAIEQYKHENMLLGRKVSADEQYKMSAEALAVAYAKEYILADHLNELPLRARKVIESKDMVTMYDLLAISRGELLRCDKCGWRTLDALGALVEKFNATRPNYEYALGCFSDESSNNRQ